MDSTLIHAKTSGFQNIHVYEEYGLSYIDCNHNGIDCAIFDIYQYGAFYFAVGDYYGCELYNNGNKYLDWRPGERGTECYCIENKK